MKKNILKINFTDGTIIMDRTFAKAAEIVGSNEYEMLQKARADYPLFHVVRRTIKSNPNKESYKGLTYEYMEEYISCHKDSEKIMAEYKELRLRAKCHSIRYAHIKKWFLETYPEIDKFDANVKTASDNQKSIKDMLDVA